MYLHRKSFLVFLIVVFLILFSTYSCDFKSTHVSETPLGDLRVKISLNEEILKHYIFSQATITILSSNNESVLTPQPLSISSTETIIQVNNLTPGQYRATLSVSLSAKDEYSIPNCWEGTKSATITIVSGQVTDVSISISREDLEFSRLIHVNWQRVLGGSGEDVAYSVQQTTDGGYIVAGWTGSDDGIVDGHQGDDDVWIVKFDSDGNIQWQKCLGGTLEDKAYSIYLTTDGGYILAGSTGSNDGDVSGKHGEDDVWIVKLNSSGDIEWQKCLGGNHYEEAYSVQQTTDGGYIIAGYSISNDGDLTVNNGWVDVWIVKLDSNGSIEWQRSIGGSEEDLAYSIRQTSDGGYIVAGQTWSNDGDLSGNHGGYDALIVKLDSNGNIEWKKCLGGTLDEYATNIQQTEDGGYIFVGSNSSNDGDVSDNRGNSDVWLVKLNSDGSIKWQRSIGGSNDDSANGLYQTRDGGYIVAGQTWSNDGDVSGSKGFCNIWIVRLNSNGNIEWQKCIGGSNEDIATSIQQTTDGGYIVVGYVSSNDGDIGINYGDWDFYILNLGD